MIIMQSSVASRRRILIVAFIAGLASSPAGAQEETVHSPEACMKAATDLAHAAQEKKLPKARLEQIDSIVMKIASLCEAEQYTEAASVARDAQTLLAAP